MDLGKEHTHGTHGYRTDGTQCQGCHNDAHSEGHPGFKAEEAKLAHNPKIHDPGAVLAAGARKASAAAHRANPRLNRVKG